MVNRGWWISPAHFGIMDRCEWRQRRPPAGGLRCSFVLVQLAGPRSAVPLAYVKRFEKADDEVIAVNQLNPPETLMCPRKRVLSIHRIVMGGEA